MEFKQAMQALHHICWAHDECQRCPMHIVCSEGISERPVEAEAILAKWAAEHPEWTIMDDFFEKFPKATRDKDGSPPVCARDIGCLSKCPSAPDNLVICSACWRRPLEEVEG